MEDMPEDIPEDMPEEMKRVMASGYRFTVFVAPSVERERAANGGVEVVLVHDSALEGCPAVIREVVLRSAGLGLLRGAIALGVGGTEAALERVEQSVRELLSCKHTNYDGGPSDKEP